jgi:hypothetical protein
VFVSPVDTLQQGDKPMAWRQPMAPFHVSSNVSFSNLQLGLFLGYGKWCLFNFVVSINLILLSSDFITGRTLMSTVVEKWFSDPSVF